jgi:hypothetical protein
LRQEKETKMKYRKKDEKGQRINMKLEEKMGE